MSIETIFIIIVLIALLSGGGVIGFQDEGKNASDHT